MEHESSEAKARSQLVRPERAAVGPSPEQTDMMSITISLTPDQEQKLEELARQSGKDPSVYVHDVVTAYLNGAGPKGVKTFEEILAPIWEGWRQSGLSDAEIDDLFQRELQEVRRERHERKGRM